MHEPHLPDSLVGQPAGVAIVVSVCKGGLQLARRCHERRVLQTHPLGISEGQTVAVVGRPVVKYYTCREAQVRPSHTLIASITLDHIWVIVLYLCSATMTRCVHGRTYINTRPPRHPHHVVTSFHLCRRRTSSLHTRVSFASVQMLRAGGKETLPLVTVYDKLFIFLL